MDSATPAIPAIGTKITEYSASARGIAELRHRLAGVLFDVAKPDDMKAAREARRECVQLRVALEQKRKDLKGPHLERGRLIDSEADRIRVAIVELETPIDSQIMAFERGQEEAKEERERLERNRIIQITAKVNAIGSLPLQVAGKSVEVIGAALSKLRDRDVTADEFQEFAPDAAQAKAQSIATLEAMLDQTRANEAEAARLAAERIELDRQKVEQARRERKEREERAHVAEVRERIDGVIMLPSRLQGMPARDIETAIADLRSDVRVVDDELENFRRWLGDLEPEWRAAVSKSLGQLEALANLSREQARQAAESKAKLEREAAEREVREDIAAVIELPATLIGSSSFDISAALAELRQDVEHTEPTPSEVPPQLAQEWRTAASTSIARLEELLAGASQREKSAAEEGERQRKAAEAEQTAREHAAFEQAERQATADAIAALQRITEVAADKKKFSDDAVARSVMAGIAAGTLFAISDTKSKAKRKAKEPRVAA